MRRDNWTRMAMTCELDTRSTSSLLEIETVTALYGYSRRLSRIRLWLQSGTTIPPAPGSLRRSHVRLHNSFSRHFPMKMILSGSETGQGESSAPTGIPKDIFGSLIRTQGESAEELVIDLVMTWVWAVGNSVVEMSSAVARYASRFVWLDLPYNDWHGRVIVPDRLY